MLQHQCRALIRAFNRNRNGAVLRTTIRNYPALGLGAFFAFVTARTIFDDVWSGAPVSVAHFQAGAALVAAIASGHMAWPELRQARVGTGLGLILIFVASTGYIVTSAGARNAELAQAKTAAILKTNEERASLKIKSPRLRRTYPGQDRF